MTILSIDSISYIGLHRYVRMYIDLKNYYE